MWRGGSKKNTQLFFPQGDNLGELMSTVCNVRVGGWVGVGACSLMEDRRLSTARIGDSGSLFFSAHLLFDNRPLCKGGSYLVFFQVPVPFFGSQVQGGQ